MSNMEFQGIDLTAEVGQVKSISWQQPHPLFVIILVGPEEIPFGIQKDLLVAKCPFYRQRFSEPSNQLENIERLPNTDVEVFGCFQNFIYTGSVYVREEGQNIPGYSVLLGVWKLAALLQMAPLRVTVLNTMAERRRETSRIPGSPLIIQAWKETEDGSGLRLMLITWAAEHMRASPESRKDFAKSLPQEILSELVIIMSDLSPAQPAPAYVPPAPQAPQKHQISDNQAGVDDRPAIKRPRKSAPELLDEAYEVNPAVKKQSRKSEPARKPRMNGAPPTDSWGSLNTPEKEIDYCKDLIDRMIRGPGYWTRLVGPFRNPVNPLTDNVPNYSDVVKKPMDLNTIKTKIHNGEYANGSEFEADVRQIHSNCYEYWTQDDPMWKSCEDFERYFNTQWSERYKWTPGTKFHRSIKAEIVD